MSNFLFEPTPNDEAIAFLTRKRPLNANAFKQLLPELKAHAFTVAGVNNMNTLQRMRDLVATVPAGADFRKVKKQIVAELAKELPLDEDLFDSPEAFAKHKAMLERRAEGIVRNNAFQAYSVSAYNELNEFRDIFTHWQYLTVGDGRVRASHAALNKVTLPNGHPFWRTHFAPWGPNCRCQIVGLTPDEYEQELDKSRKARPEDRWALEGEELARLENEGVIVRSVKGTPTRIPVSSDRERGEPNAWHWEPEDLRLSFGDLAERYDPQVFSLWQAWAKSESLGEITVADFMAGALADPVAKARLAPIPRMPSLTAQEKAALKSQDVAGFDPDTAGTATATARKEETPGSVAWWEAQVRKVRQDLASVSRREVIAEAVAFAEQNPALVTRSQLAALRETGAGAKQLAVQARLKKLRPVGEALELTGAEDDDLFSMLMPRGGA